MNPAKGSLGRMAWEDHRGLDVRPFCSIPAQHDLARRTDANYLGGLVARHVIDESDARRMARARAYAFVKTTYRLP